MTYELFQFPDGKTNYQIIDENGAKTTISLEKWVADILQIELNDVHASIQQAYQKILSEKPNLGRRQRGNLIRLMAVKTANNYQETMKDILGWNHDEVMDFLSQMDK